MAALNHGHSSFRSQLVSNFFVHLLRSKKGVYSFMMRLVSVSCANDLRHCEECDRHRYWNQAHLDGFGVHERFYWTRNWESYEW